MRNDAWRAVAELADSQHGAFTRAQSAANGIDARRLMTGHRDGRVLRWSEHVFTFAGSPITFRQRLRVLTLAVPHAVISHRASAVLLGVDGITTAPIEASVTSGRWPRVPPGLDDVILHEVRSLPKETDLIVVDGMPCTGIARTLTDLGAVVDADTVLKALIGEHRKGYSLTWFRKTAERLDVPGRSGARVLLEHLDRLMTAGTVPESWLEEVIRRIIEHPALPPLVSQYVLRSAEGRFVARFDHAFPDVRVGIEGHSRRFHFGPLAESIDEDRDLRAAREGWEIAYLGWYAQREPAQVVEALVEVVSHRLPKAA